MKTNYRWEKGTIALFIVLFFFASAFHTGYLSLPEKDFKSVDSIAVLYWIGEPGAKFIPAVVVPESGTPKFGFAHQCKDGANVTPGRCPVVDRTQETQRQEIMISVVYLEGNWYQFHYKLISSTNKQILKAVMPAAGPLDMQLYQVETLGPLDPVFED